MSIVVTNNAPAAQAEKPAGESVETTSAPVADKAAEQSKVSETDAEENEAEESEADKDESEADGDEPEAKDDSEKVESKKKSGSQRRKERAERAEAEVARLQRIVEDMALKGAGDSKAEPKAVDAKQAQASDGGRPKPESFDSHAEYIDALTDWKLDQREQAKAANDHKAKLEAAHKSAMKSHYDRLNAFKEKTTDFDDVIGEVAEIATPAAFDNLILESESGPEILYELAKDQKELERVCSLSPIAMAKEIGKLESKLASGASDEKKPEPKKQTKAPAPIVPVGSKGGSVAKSIAEIAATGTQAEYEAARAKQLAARKSAW